MVRTTPGWPSGDQKLDCDDCGAVFERGNDPYTDHVFCSPECQSECVSDDFTGDGHPNWKGGGDANYGKGWHRTRTQALERDGDQCVVCGESKADFGRLSRTELRGAIRSETIWDDA